MPIQLKLFGDLRKKVQKKGDIGSTPIRLDIDDLKLKIVSDLLELVNISESEVSHIFVNGRYSGFKKKIQNGDRVALFPKNMGLLYKWYFNREENDEK